tara:strand:+ start:1345 stop:1695 length:351 start_codon:yes stop_codon:yes gene_type:complete
MKPTLKIEKKDGLLYVTIIIPTVESCGQRMKITAHDVRNLLQEKKVKFGKCLQVAKITNKTNEHCKGVYIFEEIKKVTKKVTRKVTKKTTAVKEKTAPAKEKTAPVESKTIRTNKK